jgi:hypothetical protein
MKITSLLPTSGEAMRAVAVAVSGTIVSPDSLWRYLVYCSAMFVAINLRDGKKEEQE